MANFTDPKKFAAHVERQLRDRVIEGMAQSVERQAREKGGPLAVTLKGVDRQTSEGVQAQLRRRGWSIDEAAGNQFTVKKSGGI